MFTIGPTSNPSLTWKKADVLKINCDDDDDDGHCSEEKQVEIVWSCGEERKRGFGEEMHVYGGGGCKAKREAKKDLINSG